MVIFSDSQLRPIVQGNVKCPADWYVNCTPGGKYSNITSEIRRCTVGPALVYLLVGTNELGKGSTKSLEDFSIMLREAKQKFPNTPVSSFSLFI